MARLTVACFAFLQLLLLGAVCCLTNQELYNLIEQHDSEVMVDDTLPDDVIVIPGEADDVVDDDYILQMLGFIPYQSDDECSILGNTDEDSVATGMTSVDNVDKYCYYRQYLINGRQDGDQILDNSDENKHLDDIHFHFHFHHNHHHHHHHHNDDNVRCKCKKNECECCLRHKFRFNYCSKSFKFKGCVIIKYKGKKNCHVTTKAPEPTTIPTTLPPTTTPTPKPTTTSTSRTTTTPTPKPTTTSTSRTTTTPTPKPTTTSTSRTTTTPTPKPTTTSTSRTTTTPTPRPTTPPAPTPTTRAPTTTTESHCHHTTTAVTPPPNEVSHECDCGCKKTIYDVIFEANGRKIFEKDVSLDELRPLCYNFSIKYGTANVCLNFYSVDIRRRRVCTRLSGVWRIGSRERRLDMDVGCMTLPSSGGSGLMDILTNENWVREMIIDDEK